MTEDEADDKDDEVKEGNIFVVDFVEVSKEDVGVEEKDKWGLNDVSTVELKEEEEALERTGYRTARIQTAAMSGSGPNWLGLLKWSLQYSDGTDGSACHAMSDDDKEWLKRAMSDLVKDEPNRMSEVLNELKQFIEGINATGDANEEQKAQIEALLEVL